MTMALGSGIVDANVLIYAVASGAPQHAASRALLDAVSADPGVTFYVTSQILCEFYSANEEVSHPMWGRLETRPAARIGRPTSLEHSALAIAPSARFRG